MWFVFEGPGKARGEGADEVRGRTIVLRLIFLREPIKSIFLFLLEGFLEHRMAWVCVVWALSH